MNTITAAETLTVATAAPSWPAIGSLILTALVFPFVMHFFKKNEKMHEETRAKMGTHSETLVLHEYRIFSLEEWRKYSTPAPMPPGTPHTTQTTTVP